ncbi:TlpA family protein disulfide reductase [Pseudochryseolinea flava]|nr:TlpA disulfide reductase family protein [Pseudochryseolinea flava]
MKKLYQTIHWASIWRTIKPSLVIIAFFVMLKYTGAFSGISQITQSALMKTGVMDAKPSDDALAKDFDYNFKLRDLQGNIVSAEDFKNKTLFINLWATWCGPCRSEMPSIQSLHDKVDATKIAFIMLSIDDPDADEKVKKFALNNHYTFPIYRPVDGLPDQLHVTSIPTTFIVSPDGKLVQKKIGTAHYDTEGFKDFLEKLK